MSQKSAEMFNRAVASTRIDKAGNLVWIGARCTAVGRGQINIGTINSPTKGPNFNFRMVVPRFFWTMIHGKIKEGCVLGIRSKTPVLYFNPEYFYEKKQPLGGQGVTSDKNHYQFELGNLLAAGFDVSDFGSWNIDDFKKAVKPLSEEDANKYGASTEEEIIEDEFFTYVPESALKEIVPVSTEPLELVNVEEAKNENVELNRFITFIELYIGKYAMDDLKAKFEKTKTP